MKIIIHLKLQSLSMYKGRTQNQLPVDMGFLSKCQTGAFGMAPMSLVEIQSVELNLELQQCIGTAGAGFNSRATTYGHGSFRHFTRVIGRNSTIETPFGEVVMQRVIGRISTYRTPFGVMAMHRHSGCGVVRILTGHSARYPHHWQKFNPGRCMWCCHDAKALWWMELKSNYLQI